MCCDTSKVVELSRLCSKNRAFNDLSVIYKLFCLYNAISKELTEDNGLQLYIPIAGCIYKCIYVNCILKTGMLSFKYISYIYSVNHPG